MTNCVFTYKFVEVFCEQTSSQKFQYEYKGKINFMLVNEMERQTTFRYQ